MLVCTNCSLSNREMCMILYRFSHLHTQVGKCNSQQECESLSWSFHLWEWRGDGVSRVWQEPLLLWALLGVDAKAKKLTTASSTQGWNSLAMPWAWGDKGRRDDQRKETEQVVCDKGHLFYKPSSVCTNINDVFFCWLICVCNSALLDL